MTSMAPPLRRTRAAARQVQAPDIEREHLGRPGGGLVQHPPQRPLAQADVLAGEQLVDLAAGQGGRPAGHAQKRN